ncbi:MAG: hypothetical protein M3389_04675, partial [Actinomycetota bacterium]|nr:hypothetical protein [Actinomycetota bacterium]
MPWRGYGTDQGDSGDPPDAADSIAYVKDGDVWLATPDGSRQQQVTRTGEYHYVSQADDGTMAALVGGERIRRLSRTGDVLDEFGTYVSDGAPQGGPVSQFAGPFNPEISPDGRLIAYEWQNSSYYEHSGCTGESVPPCYVLSSRWGVGITHSDRFTTSEEFGLLTGWIGPYWMANDRLLRSNASASPNEDAVINDIGPGKGDDDMKRWFWDDNGASGVEEVEISRDQGIAAGIAGFTSDELRIYRVLYDPMTAPEQKLGPFEDNPDVVEPCLIAKDPPGGRYVSLSFAPDARHLAYEAGDGISITEVPDIRGGCGPTPSEAPRLLIPGGRHPHWGPAGIPPAEAYAPKDDGKGRDDVVTPPSTRIAVIARAAKLRTALARGAAITVQ